MTDYKVVHEMRQDAPALLYNEYGSAIGRVEATARDVDTIEVLE